MDTKKQKKMKTTISHQKKVDFYANVIFFSLLTIAIICTVIACIHSFDKFL